MKEVKRIDGVDESRRISLIAAIAAKSRALGNGGRLPWRLPAEQAYFKRITEGHPVIMGRKTWESLPTTVRPLPGRTNIVISRQDGYEASGASVVSTLEEAFVLGARAPGAHEIFIIGGGELYTLALPHASRLYLTLVEDEPEADTFFPEYENEFLQKVADGGGLENEIRYTHVILSREA